MGVNQTDVSERVVHAVATKTSTDPFELPKLYDAIDPDALDAVVTGMSDGEVCFRYAGCTLTVECSGAIQVHEALTPAGSAGNVGSDVPD